MSKNTITKLNPNNFNPFKKKQNKSGVPSLQQIAMKKFQKQRMSREDENYPMLLDEQIQAERIKNFFDKYNNDYSKCMDVLQNPDGYVTRVLKNCLISYATELVNNDMGEFDILYEAVINSEYLDDLNQDSLTHILNNDHNNDEKLEIISRIFLLIGDDKKEIIRILKSIDHILTETISYK
jgi:hypothetical protein